MRSARAGALLLLVAAAAAGLLPPSDAAARRPRRHTRLGQAGLVGARGAQRRLRAEGPEYFVSIGDDMNFYVGCQKFFFGGWNQWEVVEAGAGAPVLFGATLPPGTTGPQLIRRLMDDAVATNLTVMRAFATAVDPAFPMQTAPGVFAEPMFVGLDYALEQARQRSIKVLLSLIDNWSNPGGIDQIVGWSGTARQRTDFFSDANCIRLYQSSVARVINRVNTINGRTYSADPTIFGWNLINEARCNRCPDALQAWIQAQAAYVKSLDPNHLVSVGTEGFYGVADPQRSDFANPQGPDTWADQEGQDFIANNQVQDIDFATVHSWADNWLDPTTGFQTRWLQQHDLDALQVLRKPVVLEEFGKWVKNQTAATAAQRQQFYQLAYGIAQQSARSGGSIKGVAFWSWLAPGQVAPAAEGYGTGLYGITTADPVWATIKSTAQAMAGLSAPGSCAGARPASLPPVNLCQQTWVGGRPGTGYEGPSCSLDVNECVRGTAGCAANAACLNNDGGFSCQCYWGHAGDGYRSCTPTPQLQALSGGYATPGPSQLACPEGSDVPYPATAPGFAYDPTGWTAPRRGFGSTLPVSAADCQVACESAAGCDAFSYNPVQQQCFLKSGASPTTCTSQELKCSSSNQDLVQQTFSCGSWQTYYRRGGRAAAQVVGAALGSQSAG